MYKQPSAGAAAGSSATLIPSPTTPLVAHTLANACNHKPPYGNLPDERTVQAVWRRKRGCAAGVSPLPTPPLYPPPIALALTSMAVET